ncbi:29703_t:CDS:1, partial [Gigaspora margarita]
MSNNLVMKFSIKIIRSSNDVAQIAENFNQSHLKNNKSPDDFIEIIKKLFK